MRIATYNVLGLTGHPPDAAREDLGDVGRTVEHFAGVFAALACDVLALQEGPALPVIRAIADRLDLYLAALPSPTSYPGYVLSRHPIRESRAFSHPGPGARSGPFSRHAGAALLQVEGHALWVVDVHLHPSDRDLRLRESARLAEQLRTLGAADGAALVLGDFNAPIGEPVHQMLAEAGFVNAMRAVGGGARATMDTAGVRPLAIDHIYASPALGPALLTARVVRDAGFRQDDPAAPGTWVHSDHLPVVAELRFP